MFTEAMNTTYRREKITHNDTIRYAGNAIPNVINADSLYNSLTSDEKLKIISGTQNRMSSLTSDWNLKNFITKDTEKSIRTHESDWHKKITLSFACVFFFFIGAPLGAIIRKGGLGMPVVISVIIFILYYIIDSGTTRVAKSGEMNIVLGTWMSTIVLAPLGAFLTYKSNKDSVVFNIDLYMAIIRKGLGLRVARHLFKKEVIIDTPDYEASCERLDTISSLCESYMKEHRLLGAPNYFRIFTNNQHDDYILHISELMEHEIEILSNSNDYQLINLLNNYPHLSIKAHKSLFDNRWLNLLIGLFIPAGIIVWLNIWRFRVRLDKDLKVIISNSRNIQQRIKSNLI